MDGIQRRVAPLDSFFFFFDCIFRINNDKTWIMEYYS